MQKLWRVVLVLALSFGLGCAGESPYAPEAKAIADQTREFASDMADDLTDEAVRNDEGWAASANARFDALVRAMDALAEALAGRDPNADAAEDESGEAEGEATDGDE